MPSRVQDVDRHVGQRLRALRIARGMTQNQVAEAVGITYQQTHKYENGINRIAAGRLYQFAHALSVPVVAFFEGVEAPPELPLRERLCLESAKNFALIQNPTHQSAVGDLIRILAT